MSSIKNLANQTVWYGGSSIVARLLNYLITPYLTAVMAVAGYAEMNAVYALIPFINVIFTYGMETAFFRFASMDVDRQKVYNTTSTSIVTSTLLLSLALFFVHKDLAQLAQLDNHSEFILFTIGIIALDTLSALPFAWLRLQGRPIKFASVRIITILVTIGVTYFFLSVLPEIVAQKPYSPLKNIYIKDYQVGYVLLANLIGSLVQWLLLSKEFFKFRFSVDTKLWKEIITYSLPMIIVGFGGMVNEVADRIMLIWLAPAATEEGRKTIAGIYGGCYKLSILITLFIQAFRMGAEPFFFKQAQGKNPQRTYARVMKFFVITTSVMFLVVALFLNVWKHFLGKEIYWTGLGVVPILLLANVFLGIYYNLSVWYKISNKTKSGMYITIIGAAITIVINFVFIPIFGFYASAWATFFCYGSMMGLSYLWGQKVYPIPYATKKLLAYLMIVTALYMLYKGLTSYVSSHAWELAIGFVFLLLYCIFLAVVEGEEFAKLPVVGKYFRKEKIAMRD